MNFYPNPQHSFLPPASRHELLQYSGILTILITRLIFRQEIQLQDTFRVYSERVPVIDRRLAVSIGGYPQRELPKEIAIESLRTLKRLIRWSISEGDYDVPLGTIDLVQVSPGEEEKFGRLTWGRTESGSREAPGFS